MRRRQGAAGETEVPETSTQTLAKTTRPLLASAVIPRPRLLARLDDALKGPAVWIHGMPGAGKTCLLAGFVESRRIDALWYQVDAGDGDPGSFLHHLGHAARRRFGAQAELPTPTTTGDALPESDLRRFFRALYRHFDGPFLLVLDNCHEVPITSAVHGMFSIATQEMPARGTVVFLARAEPGPALAKLRANDALAVIGPGELHLTPEETRAIAEARGLQLDEDTLRRLGEGTRGWAAGLVLMLEHTRAGGAVTRTPQGLAPQVVFDYLAWEVFRAFESDVQHVLCAIAELRRCTGPLAEHVSSSASATPALQNLARNGYFVSRIDEASETWFELHPLFQEFLRKQAAGRFTDAERSARLREAARWLERHGQLDEAVRILTQAHDWAALDQVVARIVAGSVDTPTTAELDAWLRAAPDHDPGAHPWLAYWLACSRLADDPRAARRLFAGAHETFAAAGAGSPHAMGAALSAWGALRAVLHELDDLSLADAWTAPLESCLADGRVTLPARLRGQMERTLHAALLLRGAEAARLAACRQRAAVIDCDGAAASDPTTWPTACVEACLRGDFTAAAHGLANAPADQASAPRALAACLYHLLRGEWDAGSAAQEEARAVLCCGTRPRPARQRRRRISATGAARRRAAPAAGGALGLPGGLGAGAGRGDAGGIPPLSRGGSQRRAARPASDGGGVPRCAGGGRRRVRRRRAVHGGRDPGKGRTRRRLPGARLHEPHRGGASRPRCRAAGARRAGAGGRPRHGPCTRPALHAGPVPGRGGHPVRHSNHHGHRAGVCAQPGACPRAHRPRATRRPGAVALAHPCLHSRWWQRISP
jgi:hypothetical protein